MTTTNASIVTGPGSWYNQLSKVIEVAQNGGEFSTVPETKYSFAHDEHGYVELSLDAHQEQIDDEQMQDLFNQIKQGGTLAQQTVEYIQGKMADQVKLGEGWLAEQK